MSFAHELTPKYNSPNWAARSEFWLAEGSNKSIRKRRERENHPLILTGHGLSLRVDQGSLLVRDGNTHYPGTQRNWRFFKGTLDTPPSIVIVDGSGNISVDAIDWLAAQRVRLIRLKWNGLYSSLMTSGGHAASSKLVRWQEMTRDDPKARLRFAIELMRRKVENTLETVEQYLPHSALRSRAIANISRRRKELRGSKKPKSLHALLGIEGGIAADYFRAWTTIELKWIASKRSTIPDDWRKYSSRSALRTGLPKNRWATHPVNAMLNYGYGILMARTHAELIANGYDPAIGIVHSDAWKETRIYYGLVLDHIEPMRPVVDRAILKLIESTTFCRADFSIQHDGTCRLNPEMARRVTQLATSLHFVISTK